MAGGPTTPALVAAVSEAGGLGFLAAGYKTAAAVEGEIAAVRAATSARRHRHLLPDADEADEAAIAAYAGSLREEEDRYGVSVGPPEWSDDAWEAKLDVVARERRDVVSFTFGCPERETVEYLRALDIAVWATVTSPSEARLALDAVPTRSSCRAPRPAVTRARSCSTTTSRSRLALLQLLAPMTDRPLVAAGGIATAAGIAAVLRAGAAAAQIGSALMLAAEAGTSEPQREALARPGADAPDAGLHGRRARGIVNRFMVEHGRAHRRPIPRSTI